jgi:hypothetical protein
MVIACPIPKEAMVQNGDELEQVLLQFNYRLSKRQSRKRKIKELGVKTLHLTSSPKYLKSQKVILSEQILH